MALKENAGGAIHSFEINPRLASAAESALLQFQLQGGVNIYRGDAKIESERILSLNPPILLFLDSLHTVEFARWFIERWVMRVPPEILFHVHDVMPPSARVRFDGMPRWKRAHQRALLELAHRMLGRPTLASAGWIPPATFSPVHPHNLPTTNGVFYSEAIFINRSVSRTNAGSYDYLHQLADEYPQLSPRRFDKFVIKRENCAGFPQEWNESVWLQCGCIADAYKTFKYDENSVRP